LWNRSLNTCETFQDFSARVAYPGVLEIMWWKNSWSPVNDVGTWDYEMSFFNVDEGYKVQSSKNPCNYNSSQDYLIYIPEDITYYTQAEYFYRFFHPYVEVDARTKYHMDSYCDYVAVELNSDLALSEFGEIYEPKLKFSIPNSTPGSEPISYEGLEIDSQGITSFNCQTRERVCFYGTDSNKASSSNDIDSYDLNKYIAPIWNSNATVYAESVFVCEETSKEQNENYLVFPLLYNINELISVRSADLQTLYKEGRDYEIVNGKLHVLTTGRIPVLKAADYHYNAAANSNGHLDIADNTKAFFTDEIGGPNDPGMSRYCVAVTYKPVGSAVITAPEIKSNKFTALNTKLSQGQDIKVVSLGDSITYGWSSSKLVDMYPKCPAYNLMIIDYIKEHYNVNVTHTNLSVGGKSSSWALNYDSSKGYTPIEKACESSPDLIILGFGMNDGGSVDATTFNNNINSMVNTVKQLSPNTAVLVVGTCLPNPQLAWRSTGKPFLKYQASYRESLLAAEASWTNAAFADVTLAHMELINSSGDNPNISKLTGPKTYQDTAGSNSNHPNDYMHRIYAQVCIQSMFGYSNS
jgi:lysophospholipase L1-like esterase